MLDIVKEARNSLDFTVIENIFRRFEVHLDDTELIMPTNLKGWRVGGEAALIHFIAHWGKQSSEPQLVLHATTKEDADVQLPNLGRRHHGLVALAAASKVLINSKPKIPISEKERKALLAELFEPLYSQVAPSPKGKNGLVGAWRGERAFFLCSRRQNKEFPFYFYHTSKSHQPKVKSREDFCYFFWDVIAEQRRQSKHLQPLSLNVQDAIGAIIYELFKNTDEHGRYDVSGKPIEDSLRGVMLTLHAETAAHPLRLAEGMKSNPVKTYLSSFEREEAEEITDFLEINIFDNGPGLAQKWLQLELNSEFPVQDELRAVNECWGKYNTTSDRASKGLGLYRVAEALSQSAGFLRLRTGRLSLYRDFAQHPFPHQGVDSAPDLFSTTQLSLMDFQSGSIKSDEVTSFTKVEGLLLTILIPMDRRQTPQ